MASDHGQSFWDHARLEKDLGLHAMVNPNRFGTGHGQSLFRELIAVPLVLYGPGVPQGRVEQQVRNLDLAPTLLGLAGLPTAGLPVEGIDLVAAWRAGTLRDLPALSETRTRAAHQRSLRDGRYQYLEIGDREILFDERRLFPRDRSAKAPDVTERLRGEVRRVLGEPGSGSASTSALAEHARRALEQLGYLERGGDSDAP